MQRRQNARANASKSSQASSTTSFAATPAKHRPKVQVRRKPRTKKFKAILFSVQIVVTLIFTGFVMMLYRSVTDANAAGKNPFGPPKHVDSNANNSGSLGGKISEENSVNGFNKKVEGAKQNLEAEPNKADASVTHQRRKRTTEEANAYMASQSSLSVDGEIALKKKLKKLYDLQQKGNDEDLSPIVTRWLGKEDMPHWLPISSTPKDEMDQWKAKVETMKQEMRDKDVELFPELHGKTRAVGNIGRNALDKITYPSPANDGTHPIIKPAFGQHRSHVDAIFALAEGYDLKIYLLFIESLKQTGFTGDLVLSVSAISELKHGVEEYLKSNHKEEGEDGINVVAYTVTWTCYEGDGKTVAKGAKEGIRKCALVDMYGDTSEQAIVDPREPRPVATARYELYWAWSLHYDKHSWLMLIDSRDAYFQLDPFATVERESDSNREDGLLYFFEENAEASNIGQSSFNSRWLNTAYDKKKVQSFFDKPIICSGSTMGEQVAIESYLRGMVKQFDDTRCKLKGCDQGFHNYMYYSGGLKNVQGIRDVVVFEQGKGIINNLALLRSKPLREWGLLDVDTMKVLNWDKSVSPVAHQFDRDDELNLNLKTLRKGFESDFAAGKLIQSSPMVTGVAGDLAKPSNTAGIVYPSPANDGTHPIIKPAFGQHRSHVDAIFALAEGYDLKIYLLFIESLKQTGFTGDLVLSVSAISELKKGVQDFLRSNHKEEGEDGINVVAYTVTWTCYEGDGKTVAKGAKEGIRKCALVDMYGDTSEQAIVDPREPRPVATARYELYWAWSLHYDKHSWLMLIDSRDAYFQLDPFTTVERESDSNREDGLLYFFEENAEASNIGQSSFNSRWLNTAYGNKEVQSFFDKPIICSGSTMGEQVAIESYLRGMVKQFDDTRCKLKGCDQGFHNYMYYSGGLKNVQGIRDVVVFEQGKGIINNLALLRSKPLREWGLLDVDTMKVLNWDKSESPVAHQFDRDDELNSHLKGIRKTFLNKFWTAKKK